MASDEVFMRNTGSVGVNYGGSIHLTKNAPVLSPSDSTGSALCLQARKAPSRVRGRHCHRARLELNDRLETSLEAPGRPFHRCRKDSDGESKLPKGDIWDLGNDTTDGSTLVAGFPSLLGRTQMALIVAVWRDARSL